MVTVTTTPEWLFEASSLIYSRWSKEYSALKAVKAEQDDGTVDWQQFHAHRLAHAIEQEALWKTLKDEASRLSTISTTKG